MDPAPAEIYTLSLHDALPILGRRILLQARREAVRAGGELGRDGLHQGRRPPRLDRKSTRLNSSHVEISYAVFCLKKKKYTGIGCTNRSRIDVIALQRCHVLQL